MEALGGEKPPILLPRRKGFMNTSKYIIVDSEPKFEEMMNHVAESSLIAYDTETTGVNPRRDSVIGLAVTGEIGKGYYLPLMEYDLEFNALTHITHPTWSIESPGTSLLNLLKHKKLIMHNGAFDIPITKNNLGVDLIHSFYCDTMLLKHTIDEEHPFALKDIGTKLAEVIGLGSEEEATREQGELKQHLSSRGASTSKESYELYKGDKYVIGKYACKDVDLTLRVYNHYIKELEAQNLLEFFFEDEVMPLYKEVTIPMEQGGIPLDIPKIKQAYKEISNEIESLEFEIQNSLEELVPQFREYKFDSLYPVDKPTFKQRYAKHFSLGLPLTPSGNFSLSKKAIDDLPDDIHKQFLLGLAEPQKKDVIWALLHKERTEQEYAINLNSDKEMGHIFFKMLGEEPISYTAKTREPQFNDETLKVLHDRGYEVCGSLRDYNKLAKLKSTYIERFLNNHEDGVFYPSFFQHRTISGRYGSDLQQLPREKGEDELPSELVRKYTNMIREFFIGGPEHKLIDADYEQLELRVFTHISNDPWLIEEMNKDNDLYSTIGMEAFGVHDASASKTDPNYFKKLYPALRQDSKEFTLGVPYGMKAWQLGKILNKPESETQEIIDNYLGRAKELHRYMIKQEHMAKTKGYVVSEFGRIRRLPWVSKLYKQFGNSLEDYKYRFKLADNMGRERVKYLWGKYKNGLNNSKNFPVQSGAASIVNRAAIAIMRKIKEEKLNAYVACQVHDQLVIRCEEKDAGKCAEIVEYCMENTNKLKVKLIAKPVIADNMRESH